MLCLCGVASLLLGGWCRWHGNGQLLDYTNPAAVEWWHTQMDNVLDLGIDGFKTDGTGPFIMECVFFFGPPTEASNMLP